MEVAVRLDRTAGLAEQIYRQLRDAVLDGLAAPGRGAAVEPRPGRTTEGFAQHCDGRL
jgi:hypothetical protein